MKFQGNSALGLLRLTALGIISLGSVACSQMGDLHGTVTGEFIARPTDVTEYKVRRGDSLSKIARRITTAESNWEEIARFNNINDPRDLQTGMLLLIPNSMFPAASAKPAAVTIAAVTTPPAPAPQRKSAAQDKSDWIFQPSSVPGVLEVAVILRAVNVNRTFEIFRAGDGSNQISTEETTQLIRVVGSYYPKGIYTEPTNASKLLMRVAPGTTFEFDRKVGDWLRILTEDGPGYIRDYDAEILGASRVRRLIVSNHS